MAHLPVTGDPAVAAGQDVVSGGRPPLDDAGRARRRRLLAALVSLAVVIAAIVALSHSRHGQRPTAPQAAGLGGRTHPTAPLSFAPAPPLRANGALFGHGERALADPVGLSVPALGADSSPSWSPDGSHVAVLAGGIVVTDVRTGARRRIACPGCQEIAWSPDGRVFAASPVAGATLALVDATTGELTKVSVPGVGGVLSLTWAPGSDELAFLANAGEGRSGVYMVRDDGSDLTEAVGLRTRFPHSGSGATRPIQVRWSPTGLRLAVVTATPDPPGGPPPISVYRLRVVTMNPDGSGLTSLVGDGRCTCTGFTPGVAWSPDGTTLAVLAQHPRPDVVRSDGDGHRLRVRFVRGSGALSWQPR